MNDIELALALIIPFAIFAVGGAAVYAVFVWRNTDRSYEVDTGVGTPRRIYFYLASFVSLMMAAGGAASVLAALLDSVFRGGDFSETLAMGLALVAVGLPVWLFHWRFVQRAAARTPPERRSVLRNLHVYATLGVALGFIAFSAFSAVQLALFAGEFDGFAWGGAPIWAAVWAYHWRVASAERAGASDETLAIRRMYLYLASAVALAMAALGVAILARVILLDIYQAAVGVALSEEGLSAFGDEARSALAAALVGGAGWAAHWLMFARGDRRSVLRWAYILIAALGGGFAVMLSAFGFAAFAVMQWAMDAVEGSLADHLAILPTSLVVIIVAVVIWRYHVDRMWKETTVERAPLLARIYMMALSAMGLVAVALALAGIADLALRALADLGGAENAYTRGGGLDFRDRLAYILTLLALGCPVWLTSWRGERAFAEEFPRPEPAPVRKMYALGILCLGLLALIGGASGALFVFLSDLLADGALSAETLLDLAYPLSAVLPPAAILPYYWMVYRRERAFEPELDEDAAPAPPVEAGARKDVTLLAPPDSADALAALLSGALGYPVEIRRWSDSQTFESRPDENATAAASRAIAESAATSALVVAERGGLRVIWRD